MRIIKFIFGICLFLAGGTFQLGAWSTILMVLGGYFFFEFFKIQNSEETKKISNKIQKISKTQIKSKKEKADKIKVKGIIGIVLFILGNVSAYILPSTKFYNDNWLLTVTIGGFLIFGSMFWMIPYINRVTTKGE